MSTREQLKGDSLRRQLEKTDAYVRENGLELDGKFDDWGVSAYRGKNSNQGALARFRAAVANGDIEKGSYLIIESMDRLSRQKAMAAFSLLAEIIQCGVIVVTLDDKQEYSDQTLAANQFQLFIAVGAMVRAHEESKRKSGLLSDTWEQKRKKLRQDRVVMTKRVPAWLKADRVRQVVEVVPDRVKVVQEIFHLACNGYGMYSIAMLLNRRSEPAWGSPKRTKARTRVSDKPTVWRTSYLRKILSNRAVLGEFQPHRMEQDQSGRSIRVPDGEVITDYYPKIIDESIFREAALAIERRRVDGKGRKGEKYSNLLTGLIHCSQCGSGMRFIDKGPSPKGGRYLRCSIAAAGGSCLTKQYRYSTIEKMILTVLESLDTQRVLGGPSTSSRLADHKQRVALLEMDINHTSTKIDTLNEALISDAEVPPASTLKALRSLEKERTEKQKEANQLDDEIDEMLRIDPEKRKKVVDDLLSKITEEPDQEKRVMARRALAGELQRMIEVIVIRPDVHLADEIMDIDPSWQKRHRVSSRTRLQRYLDERGFDLSIRYRNGEQQIVSGVDQSYLKLKWNKKLTDFRLLAEHGD